MKPPIFDYHAPEDLEEALMLLQEAGWDGKLLAGGQSLVPMMNYRLVQPAVLIDLHRVKDLDYISERTEGSLEIGAMVRLSQLENDPLVQDHLPLMAEALPSIAHVQIRTRGTLGGSLAHADPAAELPVVILTIGGRIKAKNQSGERWVTAKDFFQGMFTTALEPDEILVAVELPPTPANTGWAFLEFARRPGDYAMSGVAARVTLDQDKNCTDADLVYLNAGDGPQAAENAAASLFGQPYSAGITAEAARIAAETEISPFGNIHASSEYQQHLASVLTRRALETAFKRAEELLTA